MVGCIKYLGEGKWTFDEFENAFKLKKRSSCSPPAPPCGLYLTKISYWLFPGHAGDLAANFSTDASETVGMYAAAPDITLTFE